jgi:hypothetical protein
MGFEPTTFCMASSSPPSQIITKCLQIARYLPGCAQDGFPRIAPKSQGFRQGTDNETDTGAFGWRVLAVEAKRLALQRPVG